MAAGKILKNTLENHNVGRSAMFAPTSRWSARCCGDTTQPASRVARYAHAAGDSLRPRVGNQGKRNAIRCRSSSYRLSQVRPFMVAC